MNHLNKFYYPGKRIEITGKSFVVVGVRRSQAAAQKLMMNKGGVGWSQMGRLFVVVRPADVPPPVPQTSADNPAMREAQR